MTMTSVSENNADKASKRFAIDLKTLGPALALLLLCVIGFLLNPAFVSEGNLTNLLTRSAFIGIIAVGATFVITAGGIDLSVGSMAAAISGVMISRAPDAAASSTNRFSASILRSLANISGSNCTVAARYFIVTSPLASVLVQRWT